jgi:hypothetical protein
MGGWHGTSAISASIGSLKPLLLVVHQGSPSFLPDQMGICDHAAGGGTSSLGFVYTFRGVGGAVAVIICFALLSSSGLFDIYAI